MARFSHTTSQGFADIPGMLPFVPITILRTDNFERITLHFKASALVDSGSTVNVLPYDFGEQLGFIWNPKHPDTPFIGTVFDGPALGVILFVKVADFRPVRLTFGWSQKTSAEVCLILGQTNFFDKFDIDFRKSTDYFEIVPVTA